jgi:hypothetical protein
MKSSVGESGIATVAIKRAQRLQKVIERLLVVTVQ